MDFSDRKEVELWLEGQTSEVRAAYAARSAARVLPAITLLNLERSGGAALATARAIITSATAAGGATPDVRTAADSAARSAEAAAVGLGSGASNAIKAAVSSAASSARSAALYALPTLPAADSPTATARTAAHSAAAAASSAARAAAHIVNASAPSSHSEFRAASAASAAAARSAAQSDGEALTSSPIPDLLFRRPLWHESALPEGIAEDLEELAKFWQTDTNTWGFWQRWYEGMLRGATLDWDLQRQVALIPDGVWRAGPEAIAREIQRIEAVHDLKKRIEEFERERDQHALNRHGIGGNRPPEPLHDETPPAPHGELTRSIDDLSRAVDRLKAEANSDAPSRTVVEAAIETLGSALFELAKWVGGRVTLTVDECIKWGVPTSCVYLLANPDKLAAILQAAQRWLPFLN